MCCKKEEIFAYIYAFLYLISMAITIYLFFSQDYLGLFDLYLSINQPIMTKFELRSSNDFYDYLGPFHNWGGRQEKNCIKIEGDTCKEFDIKSLNDSVNLIKISNKYLTFVKFTNYLYLLTEGYIINENKTCPKNLNKCGKIDTLNQTLCLPKNMECPIQDFRINNEGIKGYNNTRYSYKEVTEYISYTNKKTDSLIIGNISIGAGPPCINKEEENWEKLEDKEVNETSWCKTQFDGLVYDRRYTYCGELSYINIYESNLPKDVFNIMHNSSKGHKLKVYKRPYIGVNLTCFENSFYKINVHKNLKEIVNSLKSLGESYIKSSLIFIIVVHTLIGCCSKGGAPEIGLLFVFIMIIFFVIYLIKFIDVGLEFLELFTDFNCSDGYTNLLIQYDIKNLKRNFILILIVVIIFIIIFLILFITFICKSIELCCKSTRNNRRNENELLSTVNNVNENSIN